MSEAERGTQNEKETVDTNQKQEERGEPVKMDKETQQKTDEIEERKGEYVSAKEDPNLVLTHSDGFI